jgi:hypothetical protein
LSQAKALGLSGATISAGDQQDQPAIDAAMQNSLRGLKQIQPNLVARNLAYRDPVTL